MKKKQYIKPAIQVVTLQHRGILCSSPGDQQILDMPDGDPIDDEKEVW